MPAGKTSLLTVSDVSPTAVTASIWTPAITVVEDGENPTTAYEVRKSASNADPLTRPTGSSYTFEKSGRYYAPGEIAGWLQTVSGSVDFSVDESGY